jgi:ligand-binding SRPBCC domain-containing protein
MRIHVLERHQVIARPREEVFAFFAEPRNLEAITPGFLRFQVLPPVPSGIAPGTLIDYRLRLYGLPFRWRTLIEAVEPGRSFVDVQLRGPYALWEHTHGFEDVPWGTRVTDRVRYMLPLGPLGALAHPLLVRRTLERIFDHRRERVVELLGPSRASPESGPRLTRGFGA